MPLSRRVTPLAEFLKIARNRASLSQRDVAIRLKYSSAQFVSNWERGVSSPPLRAIRRLATLYQVAEDELYAVMLRETLERAESEFRRKFYGRRRGPSAS